MRNPDFKVLLITPPFTQLNTPYPATAYIKGFFNTLGIKSKQIDLGLELTLGLFCKNGLEKIFTQVEQDDPDLTDRSYFVYLHRKRYIQTIEPVIRFLQGHNPTLAHTICNGGFLPEGHRFRQLEDLQWAFGSMGTQDKAKHLATLYLEDLGDLITDTIDPHFGFSRYAERLGKSASSFGPIHEALQQEEGLLMQEMTKLLAKELQADHYDLVCLTVPFPGNLIGALTCGKYIKQYWPQIKVALGGGFANTELRSVYDENVFQYLDFITLDDGEMPLKALIEHLQGERPIEKLKRTFTLVAGQVQYINGAEEFDIPQREVGTPDYSDLLLSQYISVTEVANPMHRLWSDGRWNKLTLAHGCYWGKCSFCDVSLDYIGRYEPVSASILCDRIETIIAQTGQHGFHFVDEAAPPALMRDLALEIIRRGITIAWWTNIRFEKSFTSDLCRLLRASGCIAVTGGLEVASDRLLQKMKKGVTVAQVARVAKAFTDHGIMVHAYLMYGFPTQTDQETIDSLEYVRQMFEAGVLQSAFWHQFAMTSHSPVGLDPAAFGVVKKGPSFAGFADNDCEHEDPSGADHEQYSEGLKLSLYNFMMGLGFEESLEIWFDFPIPPTTVRPGYIRSVLNEGIGDIHRPSDLVKWMGGMPISVEPLPRKKTDKSPLSTLIMTATDGDYEMVVPNAHVDFVLELMEVTAIDSPENFLSSDLKNLYESYDLQDFKDFLESRTWHQLRSNGLILV